MVSNFSPVSCRLLENGHFAGQCSEADYIAIFGLCPGDTPNGAFVSTLTNCLRFEFTTFYVCLFLFFVYVDVSFGIGDCQKLPCGRVLEISLNESTFTIVPAGLGSMVTVGRILVINL